MKTFNEEEPDEDESKWPAEVSEMILNLHNLPRESSAAAVISAYSVFLRAVTKNAKDPSTIFQVFSSLCSFVGVTVAQRISISLSPIEGWKPAKSFKVIASLIQILDETRLPLNLEFDGYTLESWLISLVIGMTSINLSHLTPELMSMITATYRFNPLIVQKTVKTAAEVMIRPKLKFDPYVEMMKSFFDGAVTSQRLAKLIALLLPAIRTALMEFSSDVSLDVAVPTELSSHFATCVASLPNPQILDIFRTFTHHLETDVINQLGSVNGSSVELNAEVICELYVNLMFGVKVVDHSVPDVIKSKFNFLLEEFKDTLNKFGVILCGDHSDRVLKSYLKLCHTYGALQMLLDEYEGAPLKKLSQEDTKPFNLSFLHTYLSPSEWTKLFNSIVNHEDCLARNAMFELLVQKVEAVSQVEVGEDGPGSQVARVLLELADPQWFSTHLISLASLFQASELVCLVSKIIHEDHTLLIPMVKDMAFQENRRLVLATAFRLMNRISKKLKKTSPAISFQVLAEVEEKVFLEYELSLLITDDMELATQVKKTVKAMSKLLASPLESWEVKSETEPQISKPISYFDILHTLRLHLFSPWSQACIFLGILSLLHDLPVNETVDCHLLDILYNILSQKKIGDSHVVLGGLSDSALLFLSKRARNYPRFSVLLDNLVKSALTGQKSAEKLFNAVSNPTASNISLTTLVLSHVSKFKFSWEKKCKEEGRKFQKNELIEKLVGLIVAILVQEKPSARFISDYTWALKSCLARSYESQLNLLLPLLKKYIKLGFKNFSTGLSLMELLMGSKGDLNDRFPEEIVHQVWTRVLSNETQDQNLEQLCHLMFTTSSKSDFNQMLTELSEQTATEVRNETKSRLRLLLQIWSHLMTTTLSYERTKVRVNALAQLITSFAHLITTWAPPEENWSTVGPFFQFCTDLASSIGVQMNSFTLDCVLLGLSSVPLPENNARVVIDHLTSSTEALFALYLFRNPLMADRLPPFFQRYRLYLKTLAGVATSDLPLEHQSDALLLAEKLERVAKTMVKNPKLVSRSAPYVIADILALFEKHSLNRQVKITYTNIINAFLRVCDPRAIDYLSFALSPSLQLIFNDINRDFKKFHRFTGKV